MEKQRIAVILPAGKLFDRIFSDAIVPVAQVVGHDPIRISTDLAKTKLQPSLDILKSADAIVADLTARNPHIMFLVGYARGLNKPITFLTQHAEDFPFELDGAIVYGSDATYLKNELLAQLSGQRTNQNNGAEDPRARFLSIFGDLLQKHGHEHRGTIRQDEPNVFTLVEQDMDLALVQDIARRARELNLRVRLM